MRSLFAGFTTRGKSFLAAGAAAGVSGLALSEPALVRVGAVVFVLPLLSALAAGRARYRLSCARQLSPARTPAGQTVRVIVRIQNLSRLPTGLLLAEDAVPYTLGSRPRFVLERIERGGMRELDYPLRSDVRGKFVVGPLQLRVADVFGLVELGRSFSSSSTLVVSPKIVPLPGSVIPGNWLGDGEAKAKVAAAAGEDDAGTRPYRDGDELRRVHWRSTARYGELMVRREEQQWRNHVVLLLDTRRAAHAGTGASSSFEFAVSAAASIGMHLAMQGFDGQLITDTGAVTGPGTFQDLMLDTLAVVRQSSRRDLSPGLAAVTHRSSGLLIVVAGQLSAAEATSLVASHPGGAPALALLLAAATWAPGPRPLHDGTRDAAGVLTGAGWRVATVRAGTPLAAAWQRLQGAPATRPAGEAHHVPEGAR